MKLESLSIIFLIIIIPIAIVLSEYLDNRINTEKTELIYDSRLLNSTYDAIKAYQINTVNNSFGDVTTEKIQDIEAAANVFLNSFANNFNFTGYKLTTMQEYIPAIVFTLYDGYYTYAPFNNTLTEVKDGPNLDDKGYDPQYSNPNEDIYGLKPYVYYSCRYTPNSNSDFTIIYTLDNYITIQGKINGEYVYDCGYLYSLGSNGLKKIDDHCYSYKGIEFRDSDTEELKEFLGNTEYSYVKVNGKKYYLEEDPANIEPADDDPAVNKNAKIFFINKDGSENNNQTDYEKEPETFKAFYKAIKYNKSAFEYYKNAYEFSKAVLDTPVSDYTDKNGAKLQDIGLTHGYELKNLKINDSIYYKKQESGSVSSDITSLLDFNNTLIFEDTTTNIENSGSNFNQHRQAIIRYIIETNLSTSIASFKFKSGSSTASFVMPKISETDWELIENNVCAISFVQGMTVGAKIYNSYAVVPNTLTKEYIDENDIYILKNDNTYCKANDATIYDGSGIQTKGGTHNYYPGIWKLNFEQRKDITTGTTIYYNPINYLGSYTSIMGDTEIKSAITDMYTYMSDPTTPASDVLRKAYYAALGRERWSSYNVNNINYEIYGNNGFEYFLKDYN